MALLQRLWEAVGERTLGYLAAIAFGAVPALAAYLCLLPWRRRRLRRRGLSSPAAREIVLALFWMFCGGMAVLTLLPRWVIWSIRDVLHGYGWNAGGYPFFARGNVNMVLLHTFAPDVHSLYIFVGNIVMFVPFGFFAALLWRGYTRRRALLTGFAITLFVECCQLSVGRTFDIDDLLLNTLGVFCGYLLWVLADKCAPRSTKKFRVNGET